MPEAILTAELTGINADLLESDDTYPDTYGFYVTLSRDPGPEWFVEFLAVYNVAAYAGKPPVTFIGDQLCVYYLPRYADDLPRFLRFLTRSVAETNEAVRKRNSVLPDEEQQKADFKARLRDLARTFQNR